jgi:hypothetical protein
MGLSPSLFSIFNTWDSEARAWVRHVPKPVEEFITQSPLETVFMDEPMERTSKEPSLPPTAEGEGVPRREVKGGREG